MRFGYQQRGIGWAHFAWPEDSTPVLSVKGVEDLVRQIASDRGVLNLSWDTPTQLRWALISNQKSSSPEIAGLKVAWGAASWILPLVVMIASFGLWHRTRRLSRADAESEPWVLLDPETGIERVAAAVWALAILASPLVILESAIGALSLLWGVGDLSYALRIVFDFFELQLIICLTLMAEGMLLFALRQIWRASPEWKNVGNPNSAASKAFKWIRSLKR